MATLCLLKSAVVVTEIRCFKISVARAVAGQTCSVAVRVKEKNLQFKFEDLFKFKMILVDTDEPPKLRSEFNAELTLYSSDQEIVINSNTELFIFSETFKQCCTLTKSNFKMQSLKLEKMVSKSKDKPFNSKLDKNKRRSDSEVFNINDIFGVDKESNFNVTLKPNEKNFVNLRFKFKQQFPPTG